VPASCAEMQHIATDVALSVACVTLYKNHRTNQAVVWGVYILDYCVGQRQMETLSSSLVIIVK